jgi:muconolactone delta-isomerase
MGKPDQLIPHSYWSHLIEVAMGLRTGKLGKIGAAEQIEALAARMNADRSGGPSREDLRECWEFWGHYSSLAEYAQDDMDEERHVWLDRMSRWAFDITDATSVTSEEKA